MNMTLAFVIVSDVLIIGIIVGLIPGLKRVIKQIVIVRDDSIKAINSISEKNLQVFEKLVQAIEISKNELTEQIHTSLPTKIKQGFDNVKKLNNNYRNKEIKEWINYANKFDGIDQLDILEHAYDRFPDSKEIFQSIAKIYLTLTEEGNLLIAKREGVVNLANHVQTFLRYCDREDFKFGIKIQEKVNKKSDKLITEVNQQEKALLAQQIDDLEKEVKCIVRKKTESKADNDKLAELDNLIDKDGLKNYKELDDRYQKLSDSLIKHFQKIDEESKPTINVKYNEKALRYMSKSWELFKKDKKMFNEDRNLIRLVKMIGGWDPNRLSFATSTYFSSVYGEIFQGLKPKSRLIFTKEMLKVKTKE